MNCNEAYIQINLYIDNALNKEETISLEAHLEECYECRRIYDELNEINKLLYEEDKPIPFDMTEFILNKISLHNLGVKYKENERLKLILLIETVFVLIIAFLSLPQIVAGMYSWAGTMSLSSVEIGALNELINVMVVNTINYLNIYSNINISLGIYIIIGIICVVFNVFLVNKLRRQKS